MAMNRDAASPSVDHATGWDSRKVEDKARELDPEAFASPDVDRPELFYKMHRRRERAFERAHAELCRASGRPEGSDLDDVSRLQRLTALAQAVADIGGDVCAEDRAEFEHPVTPL